MALVENANGSIILLPFIKRERKQAAVCKSLGHQTNCKSLIFLETSPGLGLNVDT